MRIVLGHNSGQKSFSLNKKQGRVAGIFQAVNNQNSYEEAEKKDAEQHYGSAIKE
jgi:hypothetical protein